MAWHSFVTIMLTLWERMRKGETMKKTLSLILAAFGLFCLASRSDAATYARGPKEIKNIGFTTTITTITANSFNTVSLSTSSMPGAVYDVYLGTGAAGDYCVLYDTNVALFLTAPTGGQNLSSQLGPRLFMGSSAATTVIPFDPPLIFYSGLYAACTTAGDSAAVEFETGRGLSGN
jgi:hypothetical protein